VLDQNGDLSSAIPTDPIQVNWPQGELNDVLLRLAPCRGNHATTPEARASMLDEVGHLIGSTKDRLRGIQNKALMRLPMLFAEPS
jgi:hypothetical protein